MNWLANAAYFIIVILVVFVGAQGMLWLRYRGRSNTGYGKYSVITFIVGLFTLSLFMLAPQIQASNAQLKQDWAQMEAYLQDFYENPEKLVELNEKNYTTVTSNTGTSQTWIGYDYTRTTGEQTCIVTAQTDAETRYWFTIMEPCALHTQEQATLLLVGSSFELATAGPTKLEAWMFPLLLGPVGLAMLWMIAVTIFDVTPLYASYNSLHISRSRFLELRPRSYAYDASFKQYCKETHDEVSRATLKNMHKEEVYKNPLDGLYQMIIIGTILAIPLLVIQYLFVDNYALAWAPWSGWLLLMLVSLFAALFTNWVLNFIEKTRDETHLNIYTIHKNQSQSVKTQWKTLIWLQEHNDQTIRADARITLSKEPEKPNQNSTFATVQTLANSYNEPEELIKAVEIMLGETKS